MARARLLVVDDEPGMLRAVERVLAPLYDVTTSRLPVLALEVASAPGATFDVAILDVRMPGMDGFALMARLAVLQPGISVILMTGSADERDARLVRAIRERAFFFLTKPFDRDVLLTLVERCLELRRLDVANRAHVAELESELAAARVFQESLLPPRHGEGGGVRIAAYWEPTETLGGDFFDYTLDGTGATVLMADVSGHGAPAAMLAGMVKLAFRAVAGKVQAAQVMDRVGGCVKLFPPDRHLTAIAVQFGPVPGAVKYVNAGHPPGLLVHSGRIERLESSEALLHPALQRNTDTVPCEARLEPGDRLVLYTDGITETRSPAEEEFGAERLERAVIAAASESLDNLLHRVRAELETFRDGRPASDDVTMLVLERTA